MGGRKICTSLATISLRRRKTEREREREERGGRGIQGKKGKRAVHGGVFMCFGIPTCVGIISGVAIELTKTECASRFSWLLLLREAKGGKLVSQMGQEHSGPGVNEFCTAISTRAS